MIDEDKESSINGTDAPPMGEEKGPWRYAIECTGDGVWDWNARTGKVFFSREWKTMLGYAEDEVGNRIEEWESRVHPDDLPRTQQLLQDHMSGKSGFYRSTHRLRCKDGSYKWILDRGTVVERDADGAALRLVGTHTDVSEQKEAEERLAFHSMILNTIQDRITVTDMKGIITYVNEAVRQMYGTPRDRLLGKPVQIFGEDPAEGAKQEDIIRETVEHGSWRGKVINILPGGSRAILETRTQVVRNDSGDIVALCGISTDITRQEELRKELEESRQKLQRAQRISNIGHWEFDLNSNVVDGSATARKLYGIAEDQPLLIRDVQEMVLPPFRPLLDRALQDLVRNQKPYDVEFQIRRRDGSVVDIHSIAEFDPRQNRVFGTLQDISGRKASEAQVKRLLEEKELLLREVHHRVKNNMNTISSLIALQAADLADSGAAEALMELKGRIHGMQLIYERLYRSARYDMTNLRDYLQELLSDISKNIGEGSGVGISMDLREYHLTVEKLFPVGIVVNELVTNSLKHAFPPEITRKREGMIGIALHLQENGQVEISIEDNGTGLPDSVNTESGGGFGMEMSRLMVGQIGGRLSVLTRKGAGTRWSLEFPGC